MKRNHGVRLTLGGMATLLALAAAPAFADPIVRNLGGGWQVTIPDPDDSDFVTDTVMEDELIVEKTAVFDELDEFTGLPAPIILVFTQILPDDQTVSRISISSENITNATGVNWTSFRNLLLDHGQAVFNQGLSASFSIAPFTTRTYLSDDTEVVFAGGVVPNGSMWTPGLAKGALVIDIDLSAEAPVTFSLKELPVPEPAAGLMALAGFVLFGRRR